jgi:protein-tyrosine-phosphatase
MIGETQGVTMPDPETVVFVCEHGSAKSVLAMALFTQLAKERGLPLRAISRGTTPDPGVPAAVRDGLRADGFELRAFTPAQFADSDLAGAVAVVSFDQPGVARTVAGRVPTRTWDGLPAVSENYGLAREAIRRRVVDLIDALGKGHGFQSVPGAE